MSDGAGLGAIVGAREVGAPVGGTVGGGVGGSVVGTVVGGGVGGAVGANDGVRVGVADGSSVGRADLGAPAHVHGSRTVRGRACGFRVGRVKERPHHSVNQGINEDRCKVRHWTKRANESMDA